AEVKPRLRIHVRVTPAIRSAPGHRRHHLKSLGSRVRESAAGVFLRHQWQAGAEGHPAESSARSDRVCEYGSCWGQRSSELDSRSGARSKAAARRLSTSVIPPHVTKQQRRAKP